MMNKQGNCRIKRHYNYVVSKTHGGWNVRAIY